MPCPALYGYKAARPAEVPYVDMENIKICRSGLKNWNIVETNAAMKF